MTIENMFFGQMNLNLIYSDLMARYGVKIYDGGVILSALYQ